MHIRIQLCSATVKALHSRLQHAYRKDEVRLVRRIPVLMDLLVHPVPVSVVCERWGLSPSCLSDWQKAFLVRGMASLISRQSGGRPEKLTPRQQNRVVELSEAGPLVGGVATAGWHAVLIRVLIWRECGVLDNRPYVGTLLHHRGFAFQQARCVSDHRDAATRLAWLQDKWPAIVRAAKRCTGLSRLEDEASGAQWGSRSSTWARRGHQPEVPPSGKRTGYQVLGALEDFSGRLFSPGIEGRCNADSSQGFLQMSMAQTSEHLLLIHDGARDHTSASTKAC
jgi:transposase